jgi:ATPase subunit of ABC transporter with duplicated ATPase domains
MATQAVGATLECPAHLRTPDARTRDPLQELLSASDTTLLVVTHDRAFLGSVCDSILELGRGALFRHRTNFDGFLEVRGPLAAGGRGLLGHQSA